MTKSPQLITRREALKRGAIVGGAVLWAVPVVQTLGMNRAFAATPSDTCIASWSAGLGPLPWSQGTKKDGSPVDSSRSNPNNALDAPGTPAEFPGEEPWFSLGRDGSLVLKLGIPYYSGHLGEAVVIETTDTPGDYPTEKALVSVSSDGATWYGIGAAFNDVFPDPLRTELPLDGLIPPAPYAVRYIKLVDDTDFGPHGPGSDGFDVDAVGISCP